jgi:hypothetical protein
LVKLYKVNLLQVSKSATKHSSFFKGELLGP